jgi:hypothetical protein
MARRGRSLDALESDDGDGETRTTQTAFGNARLPRRMNILYGHRMQDPRVQDGYLLGAGLAAAVDHVQIHDVTYHVTIWELPYAQALSSREPFGMRRLLIVASADGLVLRPLGQRNLPNLQAAKISYQTSHISPLQGYTLDGTASSFEAHGVVGTENLAPHLKHFAPIDGLLY